MSFATKLSYMRMSDGEERVVMKAPKDDPLKTSLPGRLAVRRRETDGVPTAHPRPLRREGADATGASLRSVLPLEGEQGGEGGEGKGEGSMLEVVYDGGPLTEAPWCSFDDVRARIQSEWRALPKQADAVSPELRKLIKAVHPHLPK